MPELTIYAGYPNPVGVQIEGLTDIASASVGLFMVLMVAGAAAAIVRFRRSQGEEREQLKWLALSVSFVAVSLAIFGVASFSQPLNNQASLDWAENLVVAGILTVPVAIGIGVLKYRLYDIDIVINKAVVYGALAVFITLVYVAIVVGVGAAIGSRGNAVLSALAAAVVALAFQPARRRAQHLANRVVYGKRATPYEVLSRAVVPVRRDVLARGCPAAARPRHRRGRRRRAHLDLAPQRGGAPPGRLLARRRPR